MSISARQPHTTTRWLTFAERLTAFVNNYHLGPARDLICYCFDHTEENWESMPAAWHRPASGDIVLNMGVILREMTDVTGRGSPSKLSYVSTHTKCKDGEFPVPNEKALESVISKATILLYTGYPDDQQISSRSHLVKIYSKLGSTLQYGLRRPGSTVKYEDRVAQTLLNSVLGVIVHETGHSVFSQYIMQPWWKTISSYHRQIITMLEEMRCEKHQTDRIGEPALNNVRYAADIVVNPAQMREDLQKSKDDDGFLDISSIALNSVLVLGRASYGVFTESEIAGYAALVESVLGEEKFDEMQSIWKDFLDLREVTEKKAVALAERWEELFPQPKYSSIAFPVPQQSGSDMKPFFDEDVEPDDEAEPTEIDSVYYDNDDNEPLDIQVDEEKINLPGFIDKLDDEAEAVTTGATKNPKKFPAPGIRKHPSESWSIAVKNPQLTLMDPLKEDFVTSNRLTQALQTIYLTGRDKFEIKSAVPPGRLRSRAAVQNAAMRQRGLPQRVDQWKKNKFTVNPHPKLSVGIMTDCSGSQHWAESFSSRMNWILSRSFRSVHARTASVAFGTSVYITSRPNENFSKRRVVAATQNGEKFDVGCGTIEQMLHLSSQANGARMLFVISDANFGLDGETSRMKSWIKDLEQANCLVVWIGPGGHNFPKNKNVIPMVVNTFKVKDKPELVIDALIEIIKERLTAEKDHMTRH